MFQDFFSEFSNFEVLTSAIAALTLLSASIAAIGVLFVKRQLAADHERSRREGALREMRVFIDFCKSEKVMSPIVRMMDAFEVPQYRCIHRHKPFKATNEIEAEARLVAAEWGLPESDWPKAVDGNQLEFTAEYSGRLRSVWSIYMNTLESIAAAWRSGVVDREMIEEEFRMIFIYEGKRSLTKGWQEVMGGYPSITALSEKLIESTNAARGNVA